MFDQLKSNMSKISCHSSKKTRIEIQTNVPINQEVVEEESQHMPEETKDKVLSAYNSSSRLISPSSLDATRMNTLIKSGLEYQKKGISMMFTTEHSERSELFEIADEAVDPLEWGGETGWRWYTGFFIYVVIFIGPLLIGFVFTNMLQITNSAEDPSSWWKCGVYCFFIWWFLLNCYNLSIIRTKVRMNPTFFDFSPKFTMSLYSWIIIGCFMMSIWIMLYYANNKQLFWLQGPYSAIIGLFVGPVFQCKLVLPKSIARKEFWQVVLVTISATCIVIMLQAIFYCILLALLTWAPEKFSSLAIIPFIFVKVMFNYVVAAICHFAEAKPLRIIFINNNAMILRMILCWALSSQFHAFPIIFVGSVDLLQTLAHIFFVCGPLQVHYSGIQTWPLMLLFWMFGKEYSGSKPLTKEEKTWAIAERTKWVYYTILQSMGELIMPYWQMVFYYLNASSKRNRSAYMGFDKVVNGFPIIDPNTLVVVAGIMAGLDIFNLVTFTFMVRKKFANFNPFKLLNVLVKKFNWVLALSVLSVVLSVQCMMLIDCNFDINFDRIIAFFK